MDDSLVSVKRGIDTERFDYTVVAIRITLSSTADNEARVRVADALPNVSAENVAFPGLGSDAVAWEYRDNPVATVELEPGESVTAAYAVADSASDHAAAGTATIESVTPVGSSASGNRGASRLVAVAVVLAVLGAALVAAGAVPADLGVVPALSDGSSTPDRGATGGNQSTNDSSASDSGDGDGLSESREAELGTDPAARDTDGDGLDDRRESLLATDPTVADADGDGLDDGRELALNADPATTDTDGDSLQDGREADLATSPALADTDTDGLADPRELDAATGPADADTDDDGLPDGVEVNSDMHPGADPMHKDVYVEVDYMRDYRPNGRLSEVVTMFRNAPVENPDGSTGITLHVVVDEQIPYDEKTLGDEHMNITDEYFDGACRGYHYATIVNNGVILNNDRPEGGYRAPTGIAVNNQPRGLTFAFVFAHELGHDLGLMPGIPGVDATQIPFSTYHSMMNYNSPGDYISYSDGSNGPKDNDDWATINQSLTEVSSEYYTDGVTNTSKC
jgi:hypothetical protein